MPYVDSSRLKPKWKPPEASRPPTPERLVAGRSCADAVIRAMERPGRWWVDLAEATGQVDGAFRRAGAQGEPWREREELRQREADLAENADPARRDDLRQAVSEAKAGLRAAEGRRAGDEAKRKLRRNYRSLLLDNSEAERSRIARAIAASERRRVSGTLLREAFDAGLFSDAGRLAALVRKATLGERRSIFLEFDFQVPSTDGRKRRGWTGFLVERLTPDDRSRWTATIFAVDAEGGVQVRPFVSVVSTAGMPLGRLPAPFLTFSPMLKGMPHGFFYSGIGKLDNDAGRPSFAVPMDYEDSVALSLAPIYQDTVGTLLDESDAAIGFGQRSFDRGFLRSVTESAGHLQCPILALAMLNSIETTGEAAEGSSTALRPASDRPLTELLSEAGILPRARTLAWVNSTGEPIDGSGGETPNFDPREPMTIGADEDDAPRRKPTLMDRVRLAVHNALAGPTRQRTL